ncbi:MAG: LAGLIDADG family homing endonuclease [Candidatus Jorgensenbacteria bacterium]
MPEGDARAQKIAATMRRRRLNNFRKWRSLHPIYYASLRKSGDLAEFYGTMLGDGCIEKFPRTEKLSISFNSKEIDHINHIAKLIAKLFKRESSIRKHKGKHCVALTLYQKNISSRLKFPTGIKRLYPIRIPFWIRKNGKFLIKCLKGLFETDGDWVVDKRYGTNVIKFTNVSQTLLNDVHRSLRGLGFTAHNGHKRVTISKKTEVEKIVKMIKFRQY